MTIANSANLTASNLISQSFANLFNLINNKSNVSDPLSTNSTRQFVYSREPNVAHQKFEGYPFIIVWPTRASFSQYNLAQDTSKIDFDFMVEVRCTDNLRGKEGEGKAGRTAQTYLDEISDDIIATLNNSTNRKILNAYGQGTPLIDTQDIDAIDVNDSLVWVRIMMVSFKKRLRIG